MTFKTPTDIGNRALQHVGAELMGIDGFTENSKNARQVAFCYDKLRRAELQRNVWTFATRRTAMRALEANSYLLAPALWVETTTYFAGSIVSDEENYLWSSLIPNNIGNHPMLSTTWEPYFGPLSVPLYDNATSYFSGEVVYTTVGDGTFRVYRSLTADNSDNPATATAWSATVTYAQNQTVTYLAVVYQSRINFNLNQIPTASAANWNSGTTYGAAAAVTGSNGIRYTSIAGANLGNDPVTTVGFWTNTGILTPWTSVFTGGTGSLKWLQIGGAEFPAGVGLEPITISYPIGTGPSWQPSNENVFRLPAGFLRPAPQNPKTGAVSWLGAPGTVSPQDWKYEGAYIISTDRDPLVFRFVADRVDVRNFSDMFAEGLAARIAVEICEPLTQSATKIQRIEAAYRYFMAEARLNNGIEAGADEIPLDDFIACRM